MSNPNQPFEKLPPVEAKTVRALARRPRRNWTALLESVAAGNVIFVPGLEDDIYAVKYFGLYFRRRGKGERLHTARVRRDGVMGRTVWVG